MNCTFSFQPACQQCPQPQRPQPQQPIIDIIGCVLSQIAQGQPWWQAILGCIFQPPTPPGPNPPGPNPPGPNPPTPGPGLKDPVKARVQLNHSGSGCTGTILEPLQNGQVWILTAAHCVPGVGAVGEAKMTDGRVLMTEVIRLDERSDLAILLAQQVTSEVPYAGIASTNAQAGTRVWHMGYGIDVPGNREDGTVVLAEDSYGQCEIDLSVSPGDSGSGIYRNDTGEVMSVVCCGYPGTRVMFGGNANSINRLLNQAKLKVAQPSVSVSGRPFISCQPV